jgi:hypothetical protein
VKCNILKKVLCLVIGVELIIGWFFYLLLRPKVLFFSLLNIETKPILVITDSILINSLPSFLSNSILLVFARLITVKYNTNIVHLLILTIILSTFFEFIQFFFVRYSTPDVWDILFGILGSFLTFLTIVNLWPSKIESRKYV